MGWAAVFADLDAPALMLYAGSVLWVIGYDTIYAHQDKEDDAIVGVRSTARLFGRDTKSCWSGSTAARWCCFAAPTRPPKYRPRHWRPACRAAHMWRQVQRLDIGDPDQCLRLFKSNTTVGWLIFLGLLGGGLWVALKPIV